MGLIAVLNKTPGLLFTLMLIAFVIGSMVISVTDAKRANEAAKKATAVVTAATTPTVVITK